MYTKKTWRRCKDVLHLFIEKSKFLSFYSYSDVNTGPPNGPVRLSSSVTLPAGGRAGRRAWRVGGRVADTAWRASTVTSCNGDTLLGLGLWLVLGLGLELDFSTWKEWDFTSASRYVATTFHKTNAVHVRYPHVVYFPSTLTGWSRLSRTTSNQGLIRSMET